VTSLPPEPLVEAVRRRMWEPRYEEYVAVGGEGGAAR
jgi:hypothetical protein